MFVPLNYRRRQTHLICCQLVESAESCNRPSYLQHWGKFRFLPGSSASEPRRSQLDCQAIKRNFPPTVMQPNQGSYKVGGSSGLSEPSPHVRCAFTVPKPVVLATTAGAFKGLESFSHQKSNRALPHHRNSFMCCCQTASSSLRLLAHQHPWIFLSAH
jgi:hypothetical protein